MLEKINYPEDLRSLNFEEKKILAQELREKIIDTVSNTGRTFGVQPRRCRNDDCFAFCI